MSPPSATSADGAGRRAIVAMAGHTGDLATVRAHVRDEDASVRSSALGALVRLGALHAKDLIAGLHDPGTTRRAIELSAGNHSEASEVDHLLRSLTEGPDADLAESAVWALGERWQERGDEPDCSPVLDVVESSARRHDDALVREAAVAALGAIGATRSVGVIIDALTDKATVRRRAVIALAPFEGPAVDAALATARNDRDWQVRQAAEDLSAP